MVGPSQSPKLNPVENKWFELNRKKNQHELVNLKVLERFCMEEWSLKSLVRCSANSSGIKGEDLELISWEKEVAKSINMVCQ